MADTFERPSDPLRIGRRPLLAGLLAAGACGGTAHAQRGGAPVVATTLGRVRGALHGRVAVFRGIPYAASTAGPNRFLPPQPATGWSGIRDALQFGRSAPQPPHHAPERIAFSAIEPIGEDCLSLNVYTPGASRSARRPVMVWLHGGGWRAGAGSAPGIRGVQLANLGDVVLVTINHRIELLGFLRIDDGDPRFADSGNSGVLDMVAALRWVRDNAEAFGGDPRNVTIFGQSGGGSKVAALMATPHARGLYHKAIAMSCSGCLRITGPEEATALAAAVAKKLGMAKLTGRALQSVPLDRLIAATSGAHRPIVDGRTFTRHPFDPDAPPTAAGIPLLIGNVANETRMMMAAATPDNFQLDEGEVKRRLSRYLRADPELTSRIMAAYRRAFPADSPGDLLGHVSTEFNYIRNTRRMADLQSAQAPVYSYMFMRRTPVMGGLLRSPHEAEVPFVFGTTAAAANMVGTGADIAPLTRLMITTWATFARTGDPNNRLLPPWRRHVARDDSSMLLDVASRFGRIPAAEARATLDPLPYYEYSMPTNYTRA